MGLIIHSGRMGESLQALRETEITARDERQKLLATIQDDLAASREIAFAEFDERIQQAHEQAEGISRAAGLYSGRAWEDEVWTEYSAPRNVAHGPRLTRLGSLRFELPFHDAIGLNLDIQDVPEKIKDVPMVGGVYKGTVRHIKDFGAIIEIMNGLEGLLHISDIAHSYVEKVEDYMQVGDNLELKLIEIRNGGEFRFSRKDLLPKPGGVHHKNQERGGSQGSNGIKGSHQEARSLVIPAMLPIIGFGNLFLMGSGTGLDTLRTLLQSVALRLLASVPPGRMRLTLIDPVGLGQHFKALLNLDEYVRGAMAWHEPGQINDAMEELTAHMSTVVQKYLTNQYENIEAYNEVAGEVAEPYRLLLISDFPAGFDDRSAERLLSIAQNGPRLGVYVLLSWDQARPLPYNFAKAKAGEVLCNSGTVVSRKQGRHTLTIEHPDLADGTLTPDSLPDRSVVDRIVESINSEAKQAQRIEVQFDRLTPTTLWQEKTVERLASPIGRSGTKTLPLVLGEGTAHHVLIGGQTGSGKSVLLHTLICSLCLHHSPDEVQLYLVDFKEGVEMALYRTLPHARVVAIESEREFGLSVLRGLRSELERRGDLFRSAGTSNIKDYRTRTEEKIPRILLVVDEFQVFFERNDRLAAEARALLDFLVREGRGFGIHVLLASQSLPAGEMESGTLGQFGVRIALRMNETESYRLLAKDNDAARYLERPGEALYNDHGGAVGGNTKFQVAYLPDGRRAAYLDQIVQHAEAQGFMERPLVFEGNKPAALEHNRFLVQLTETRAPDVPPRAVPLFLGEPVRIQDTHTAFKLRRQSRSNLLVCGQDIATAMSIFLSACWSFLAHHKPGGSRLSVLDLSNVDSNVHGQLAVLQRLHPDVEVGGRRETEGFLQAMDEELVRRISAADSGESTGMPWVLALFGFQAARALQKEGYKATPETEAFQRLLLEGPDLGLHVMVWVNTYSRLSSVLENKYVSEFEGRVALRGGDSEKLLPQHVSGIAVKPHYGLYYNQEEDDVQKFRCYGTSVHTWLRQIHATKKA